MTVIAKILDRREDGGSHCFLSRISLEDYVNGLPSSYQDYDVQREIVSNVYLDHLVDTVLERRHIPPIVLVVENGKFNLKSDELEITEFKILDGLQRTFRLQAIRKTIDYCVNELKSDVALLEWNKFKFSREFSANLREINSNTDVLRSVLKGLQRLGAQKLYETFSENGQWFEVWTGLSPDEEVKKMLVLNAGHKPVKARHQLELLFLNLLPVLRAGQGSDFQLVREKEVSATQFSKNRDCGSFHFAHIITSLLSFYAGKPVTPTTGLIQGIQSDDTILEDYGKFISHEFLKDFVAFLVQLDQLLFKQYGDVGITWLGREVSLAGLFGALGSIAGRDQAEGKAIMQKLISVLSANPQVLDLMEFEQERNSLDLSKVNIGNANRAAVFSGLRSLLSQERPSHVDWKLYFRTEAK